MVRTAIFTTGLAAILTLGIAAQEPHAASSTTPDTPVSVTENKNMQQATGNNVSTHAKRHSKAEAKAAKEQRKALKEQDKANREAMKSK